VNIRLDPVNPDGVAPDGGNEGGDRVTEILPTGEELAAFQGFHLRAAAA
jgi:hypothetical protein